MLTTRACSVTWGMWCALASRYAETISTPQASATSLSLWWHHRWLLAVPRHEAHAWWSPMPEHRCYAGRPPRAMSSLTCAGLWAVALLVRLRAALRKPHSSTISPRRPRMVSAACACLSLLSSYWLTVKKVPLPQQPPATFLTFFTCAFLFSYKSFIFK
jgi:hypothetical protein